MGLELEPSPTGTEITAQVKRLLASKLFNTSPLQCKILVFVVENALLNEPIKEIHIKECLYGDDVYAGFQKNPNKTRAMVGIVREKIEEYYDTTGMDDLIRITLPPGPAYKPRFTYNSQSPAILAVKRGISLQGTASYDSLGLSEVSFAEAKMYAPEYAPIYESWGETTLLLAIFKQTFSQTSVHDTVYMAAVRAMQTNALSSQAWLALVVIATYNAINFRWDQADWIFQVAVAISPTNVNANMWYAAYLITTGEIQEGAAIVRGQTREFPESIGVLLAATFLHYISRDIKEARTCLTRADILAFSGDMFVLLKCLISLEEGKPDIALTSLNKLSDRGWQTNYYKDEKMPGLKILCLVRNDETEAAENVWAVMCSQLEFRPLQFAIAHMAFGRNLQAIEALSQACKEGDMFTCWLHRMPLFEPLRDEPRFVWLTQRMSSYRRPSRSETSDTQRG